MIIRSHKTQRTLGVDEPIKDTTHGAPVTRRELIARGFMTGPAVITAPALLAMMFGPDQARAMSPDLEAMLGPTQCAIQAGAGKVPFICFDLAGGANLMGSEVLLGQSGNPLNFLSTAGYAKLGLPGNMQPNSPNPANTCQYQRLLDRGAFGERYRQQPAQPDVRHQHRGCRWPAADADRIAEQ